MNVTRRAWMGSLTAATLAGTVAAQDKSAEKTGKLSREELEKAFSEQMSGTTLTGNYSVVGKDTKPASPERYELKKVAKVTGDLWLFEARIKYGKTDKLVYDRLTTAHPIDLTRWQVANCYMGRIGLINSGGASAGESDLFEAVRTAVVNKRAGGMGLIAGRKAFQRPMADGVALLNAIQDVYLDESITVA